MSELVALVSCGARKLDRPAPARELYTGSLFQAARVHVEQVNPVPWFVLSGRHGLVEPSSELAPYNQRAPKGKAAAIWAAGIVDELAKRYSFTELRLVMFAGADYEVPIRLAVNKRNDAALRFRLPDWIVEAPLAGLTLGARLSWFKRERENYLRGKGDAR